MEPQKPRVEALDQAFPAVKAGMQKQIMHPIDKCVNYMLYALFLRGGGMLFVAWADEAGQAFVQSFGFDGFGDPGGKTHG